MSMFYPSSFPSRAPGMGYPLGPPISIAEAAADTDRMSDAAEARAHVARQQQQQAQTQKTAGGAGSGTGPADPMRMPAQAAPPGASSASSSTMLGGMGGFPSSSSAAPRMMAGPPPHAAAYAQGQPQQPSRISSLASILARQAHAAQLAELAAVEYERAALDFEKAAAQQGGGARPSPPPPPQPPVPAAPAPQQGGASTSYEIALAQARLLGQQLGLHGLQGIPGSGGMSMPPPGQLAQRMHPMQQMAPPPPHHQQQQQPQPPSMMPTGPAGTSALAAGTGQENANAKPTAAVAKGTSKGSTENQEDGGDKKKASIEDQLDAAEAVLSLMGGSGGTTEGGGAGAVSGPSAKHIGTATMQQQQQQQQQQQKHSYPPMPFAPSAQQLWTQAPLNGTLPYGQNPSQRKISLDGEGKKKSKKRRSSAASLGSGDGEKGDESRGDGKGGKRKRKKKRDPDHPRRPLSAYNIFFSEERARIIKEIEQQRETNKVEGANDQGQHGENTASLDSSQGPLKKRRMSSESTDINNRRMSLEFDGGGNVSSSDSSTSSPTFDGIGAAAGQKAQEILLDRRVNPSGYDPDKRRHRKTHGKISFKDLARQIGQKWKALPPDRLEEYKKLAEIDMKRYKADMARWNSTNAKASEV